MVSPGVTLFFARDTDQVVEIKRFLRKSVTSVTIFQVGVHI